MCISWINKKVLWCCKEISLLHKNLICPLVSFLKALILIFLNVNSLLISYPFLIFIDYLRYLFLRYESVGRNFLPCGITGNFHWLSHFGRTVELGSTHPRTGMSLRDASWVQKQPVRRADNLTTFTCRISRNCTAHTPHRSYYAAITLTTSVLPPSIHIEPSV